MMPRFAIAGATVVTLCWVALILQVMSTIDDQGEPLERGGDE